MSLKVKTLAFRNAPPEIIEKGKKALTAQFPETEFCFADEKAEILYFLTGGSEREAIAHLKPGQIYLMLAGFSNNAFAAAIETLAWARYNNIMCELLSLEEAASGKSVQEFARISEAYNRLKRRRAALIGNVSHWLVASAFSPELFKNRLGVELVHLPWNELPDYLSFETDNEFAEVFHGFADGQLEKEARISSFLKTLIAKHRLDALTIECFDMVNENDVSACLALGLLNSRNIAAACEGDLVSLAGMMLCQELMGIIPWMANVSAVEANSVLFAHCTAPVGMLSEFVTPTHFETDKSAAVQGKLLMEEVSILRLNQNLDQAFVSTGRVISKPSHGFACRTQVEIEMPENDVQLLKKKPLGNHHLIIPGRHEALLRRACAYKGIAIQTHE